MDESYDADHDGYGSDVDDYSDYNEMAELEADVEGDGEKMPEETAPVPDGRGGAGWI